MESKIIVLQETGSDTSSESRSFTNLINSDVNNKSSVDAESIEMSDVSNSSSLNRPSTKNNTKGESNTDPHTESNNTSGVQPTTKKRHKRPKKQKFKLYSSSYFNHLFFVWINNLRQLGCDSAKLASVILCLNSTETALQSGRNLEKFWELELLKNQPSLKNAIIHAFWAQYFRLGVYKLVWIAFTWIGNFYALNYLLNDQKNGGSSNGYVFAALLGVSCLLSSLAFHHLTISTSRVGIQCRAGLMVLVYRKSLKLSYIQGGVGEIVNLISIECNRMAEAFIDFHYLWSPIVECIILIIFAYKAIGISSLAPVFLVILIIFPVQFLLSVRASSTAVHLTNLITKRVHWMSEILTTIKLIKMFTWEQFYQKKLTEMRESEMKMMRTELRYKIASFMLAFATPALSVTLAVYISKDLTNLTPTVVFSLLFLFNTLRYPLNVMQTGERSVNGALAAMKKLENFLLLPEIDNLLEASKDLPPGVCMKISGADFVWDGDLDHPHVYELDLELKRGQIIAVVGDIGSAKSLLAAIMGQIKKTAGTVLTDGSKFGYVPQEPWFINASIRDNIDFGLEHDEKRYAEAIRISGLTRDIMLLSNGDQSYITDLSLSISQKHRLALARCIYHNPGIILMENFLEDFSTPNAKQLFKESIRNQLSKNACVVIATQQKQFLPDCDLIIVMKGGRIVERGTFVELKTKCVNFSPWVTDVVNMEDDPNMLIDAMTEINLDTVMATSASTAGVNSNSFKPPAGNLLHMKMNQRKKPRSSPLALAEPITSSESTIIRKEINEHTISKLIERTQGVILTGATRPPTNFANQDVLSRTIEANSLTIHSIQDFDVGTMDPDFGTKPEQNPYLLFVRDSPGLFVGLFLIISSTSHGFRLLSDIFFAHLVEPLMSENQSHNLLLAAIFSGCVALSILFRGFGFLNLIIVQGEKWHRLILNSVLAAPMSFYEITPLGHILSFFAKHLYSVDEVLPDALLQVVSFVPLVLGALIISCVYVPWLWATLPVLLFVWAAICRGSLKAMDTFGQLETSNKSPMFAHLSNTLEGLFHIRLYDAQEKFDHYNRNLIDNDHKALYSLLLTKALLSAALDFASSIFILLTALFCVAFKVSAAYTGLAVTNALQLLLFLPWLIRMAYVLHGSMSSISSLTFFAENVPKEKQSGSKDLDPQWPKHGAVEFKNFTSRYHRFGVLVLKNVSFVIEPGEKVAIVGRSGSGKSSIMMSLLRIIEPFEGSILIDGIDISGIKISDLRSRIAVIPQEPVMLTGTFRTNLDPFEQATDEQIWEALKVVHLHDKIKEMPAKLDTPVMEHGRMFNISERQLFCIARAKLINSTILVFDEPAVTVDRDTELLISKVMKESFQHCTVIFLATRFRALVQMGRVMVMHKGQIVEFDTPLALLDNPKSRLSLMISQTGDVDVALLRRMALSRSSINRQAQDVSRSSSQTSNRVERRQSLLSMERQNSVPSSLRDIYLNPNQSSSATDLLQARPESTPILGGNRSQSATPPEK